MTTIIAEMIYAPPRSGPGGATRTPATRRATAPGPQPVRAAAAPPGASPACAWTTRTCWRRPGASCTALAQRYRGHPALGGYDVWNECNITRRATATARPRPPRFREWLRARYGDPRALGTAWRRYSLADWADVEPPRQLGPYPEVLDWLRFRIDNAYRLLRWRVDHPRARPGPPGHRPRPRPATLTRTWPPVRDDEWRRGGRGRGLRLHLGPSRAGATSPGSSGTPSTWCAPGARRRSRSGTPRRRPARSGCSRRCWAGPAMTGASPRRRTSASGV